MALFGEFGKAENDLGEWEEFGLDEQTGNVVSFKIRSVPDHTEASIRKRILVQRDGSMDLDLPKERAIAIARCRYALLDSRNFEGQARDEEAAQTYERLLGLSIVAGAAFSLDGHWTPALKDHVLSNQGWLRAWSREKRAERDKNRRVEESLDSKNS